MGVSLDCGVDVCAAIEADRGCGCGVEVGGDVEAVNVDWDCGENVSMEVDRGCEYGVGVGEGVESVSGEGGVQGGGVEGSW
jgi:hypothetical protein